MQLHALVHAAHVVVHVLCVLSILGFLMCSFMHASLNWFMHAVVPFDLKLPAFMQTCCLVGKCIYA